MSHFVQISVCIFRHVAGRLCFSALEKWLSVGDVLCHPGACGQLVPGWILAVFADLFADCEIQVF